MIKLFVTDLDGSILDNYHNINENNLKALQLMTDMGIKFVFATGRVLNSALYYMNKTGFDNPVIANNGAICALNSKTVLESHKLSKAQVSSLINICKEKNKNFHFYDENTFYCKHFVADHMSHLEISDDLGKRYQTDIVISDDPLKIAEERHADIFKFQITEKNDKQNLVNEIKKINLLNDLYFTYSGKNSVEIMNGRVNKYNAILKIADFFAIKPDEIATMGDFINDIEMLENAKVSFSVNNALECVKEKASFIVNNPNKDNLIQVYEKIKEINQCLI